MGQAKANNRRQANRWHGMVLEASAMIGAEEYGGALEILAKLADELKAVDARYKLPVEKDLPYTAGESESGE